jgi:hypothetical protein
VTDAPPRSLKKNSVASCGDEPACGGGNAKRWDVEGVTFRTMRHAWVSWQVQAKTPLRILQELGGWATLEMPLRYAHLDPGHLAEYADASLLGPDTRRKSVIPSDDELDDDSQVIDFNGKGETRTLDPAL